MSIPRTGSHVAPYVDASPFELPAVDPEPPRGEPISAAELRAELRAAWPLVAVVYVYDRDDDGPRTRASAS
jgi:hypothetical protein